MLTELKFVITFTSIILGTFFLYKVNLPKEQRADQIIVAIASIPSVLIEVLIADRVLSRTSFSQGVFFYGGEVFALNITLMVVFLAMKIIMCFVIKKRFRGVLKFIYERWYEYNPDEERWFLAECNIATRELMMVLSLVTEAFAIVIIAIGWGSGDESAQYLRVFPCAAVIIVTEICNFLNGYTRTEFEHVVSGKSISSSPIVAFQKLRKVYEALFPAALLVSHTGSEFRGKEGASGLIAKFAESENVEERIVGEYFNRLDKANGFFDVDLIKATKNLLAKKSTIIFNPFYRDLDDYILLPVINNIINNKKCLIIVGRIAIADDVKNWISGLLENYSRTKKLWKVSELCERECDCDVGVLTFSQLYDLDVMNVNRNFLENTGQIFLMEPSKMLTTSQTGLSILVGYLNRQETPVYCVCDHNVDGLADNLSHVLHTSFTDLVAAPIPRNIYTAIAWSATGDFLRQKLFGKQARYIGNGMEIAAVALKNQIPHVTWYSAEKAPVKDIKWIAEQYYPQICKYANLPNQQNGIEEHITFSANLWSTAAKESDFIIVEDEFCNLFATIRTYLARGTNQSFVNVISESYLLRDYMRYNRAVFMMDSKALPLLAPHYVRSARNTILQLVMIMAARPIKEDYIKHELILLGYEDEDIYETLTSLIGKYTEIQYNPITIQNKMELDNDFSPIQVCNYSIRREVFEDNFAGTLKAAYFVVEDETFNTARIDAKLFGHITQTVMPGQLITHDGRIYRVKRVSAKAGCILERASDLYKERLYYKQLRTYTIKDLGEIISSKTVMDIEVTFQECSIGVETTGYLELRDNHDLRSARVVDLSQDPNMAAYQRSYKNKRILKLLMPETDIGMRFTIAILLSEILKTMMSDAMPYLAVLTIRPKDDNGILDKYIYQINGELDDRYIYLIEDSDIDLGILEAIESNLTQIFEIMTDYLDWHLEKITESPSTEPAHIDFELEGKDERQNFLSRIAIAINRLLNKNKAVNGDRTLEASDKQLAQHETEKSVNEEVSDREQGCQEDLSGVRSIAGEKPAELSADFTIQDSSNEEDETNAIAMIVEESISNPVRSEKHEEVGNEASIFEIEESLFGLNVLDLKMKIRPSRYQKECFLKFGFGEIDNSLQINNVSSYLNARGWGNNYLTKARKRQEYDKVKLNLEAENHCDFCGMPLSGVGYDRLSDGRCRCNECSMTAVNEVEEFRRLFSMTEILMTSIYNVTMKVPISIKVTDAWTVARMAGRVFRPSMEMAVRVLGFAQKKRGKYIVVLENGSPRLAAIDTITHELTHIWQYINWNDTLVHRIYAQKKPELTEIARDVVYEGMAMWSAVQLLYTMGEGYYAEQQEYIAEHRCDIYGWGFKLYKERYGFVKNGDDPLYSPFSSFPPLEPEKVQEIVDRLFLEDDE